MATNPERLAPAHALALTIGEGRLGERTAHHTKRIAKGAGQVALKPLVAAKGLPRGAVNTVKNMIGGIGDFKQDVSQSRKAGNLRKQRREAHPGNELAVRDALTAAGNIASQNRLRRRATFQTARNAAGAARDVVVDSFNLLVRQLPPAMVRRAVGIAGLARRPLAATARAFDWAANVANRLGEQGEQAAQRVNEGPRNIATSYKTGMARVALGAMVRDRHIHNAHMLEQEAVHPVQATPNRDATVTLSLLDSQSGAGAHPARVEMVHEDELPTAVAVGASEDHRN